MPWITTALSKCF